MGDPGPDGLAPRLGERVRRRGPLPFSEFVEASLYDPAAGFYTAGRGAAGRRGDFLTSPEVGPLFGAVLARALDSWWDQLDRPDPYTVVEIGAGAGALARAVLVADPLRCRSALDYQLVELAPRLRAEHDSIAGLGGSGADLPDGPIVGAVIANEWLDNVPFDLLVRQGGEWCELRVAAIGGGFVEVVVPATPADAELADALAGDAPDGARLPLQRRAAAAVATARASLERGRLVLFDYASETTDELVRRSWTSWVRTYRAHDRGEHPLIEPGSQDITTEVAIDQLAAAVDAPLTAHRQADFLRGHGIDELVAEGRAAWDERSAVGDLAAMTMRSRVREAEALLDLEGLGGFWALEWIVE